MNKIVIVSIAIMLLFLLMTLLVACQEKTSPQPMPAPVLPSDTEAEPTPTTPAPAVLEPVPTPAPDPLESVRIVPVEVAAGNTQQLEAITTDKHGNRLNDVIVAWTMSDERAGSVTQAGLFTAAEVAGTFNDAVEVEVRQGEILRTAMTSVTVTSGPLEQIVIAPNPAEIGIGVTQQFVAVGADRYGNRISDLVFSWSVENGGGTIDGVGLFTAGATPGTYEDNVNVEATQGSVTRFTTANVTVEPDRFLFLSCEPMFKDKLLDIHIMDTDGSNMKRLTSQYETEEFTFSCSPDGRRIVYNTIGVDGGIMVMNIDGSGELCLIENDEDTSLSSPVWSPDGTRIAFSSYSLKERDSDIYVMDADGSNVTQLTDTIDCDESEPDWSLDGTRIAFSSYCPAKLESDIYVIDADGGNLTQLTDTIHPQQHNYNSAPDWSPDGTRIMFSNRRTTTLQTLSLSCVMNADGSDLKELTTSVYFPAWSPDGAQIYYEFLGSIYVMDADLTNKRKLASDLPLNGALFDELAWSPDFTKIIYTLKIMVLASVPLPGGGSQTVLGEMPIGEDIYIIDTDGQNQVCLSGSLERWFASPCWVPRKRGVEVTEESVIIPDASTPKE